MILAIIIVMFGQLLMWTTSSVLKNEKFNKAQDDKSQYDIMTLPIHNLIIRMLLAMAGVETNPGPGAGQKMQCAVCDKTLSCKTSLNRHLRNVHQSEPVEKKIIVSGKARTRTKREVERRGGGIEGNRENTV